MSCLCGSNQADEVTVFEALSIRFPRLENMSQVTVAVRYGIAKAEVSLPLPGIGKRHALLNVINLLLEQRASPELRALVQASGGNEFLGTMIDMVCHAGRTSKKVSKGV